MRWAVHASASPPGWPVLLSSHSSAELTLVHATGAASVRGQSWAPIVQRKTIVTIWN